MFECSRDKIIQGQQVSFPGVIIEIGAVDIQEVGKLFIGSSSLDLGVVISFGNEGELNNQIIL